MNKMNANLQQSMQYPCYPNAMTAFGLFGLPSQDSSTLFLPIQSPPLTATE